MTLTTIPNFLLGATFLVIGIYGGIPGKVERPPSGRRPVTQNIIRVGFVLFGVAMIASEIADIIRR